MSSKVNAKEFEHPYYPWDLKFKNYVPNKWNTRQLLGTWGVVALVVIVVGWILSGKRKEQFCFKRRVVLCWFLLCFVIHTFLEGYFAAYHATLVGESNFLAESWKEYAKGDSRYVTSDPFLVCMESFTAIVDGPLALLTFFAFLRGLNWRYASQMLLSLCQLYGDLLYFATEFKAGFKHGPGHAKWNMPFHFLALNMVWIVVPLLLILDAWNHMAECQTNSDAFIDEFNRRQQRKNKLHNH